MSRATPSPRYVALLALCVALPAAALAQVTTDYEQGNVGVQPITVREFVIPNGQCSGKLNLELVCQDSWRPAADLLKVRVRDHSTAYIKMRADLSQALVYRNDGDQAAACPGAADIVVSAHCIADPGPGLLLAQQ